MWAEYVEQLDHLQKESERLTYEKPAAATVIDENIVMLTELWDKLKQTVRFHTVSCTAVVHVYNYVRLLSTASRVTLA